MLVLSQQGKVNADRESSRRHWNSPLYLFPLSPHPSCNSHLTSVRGLLPSFNCYPNCSDLMLVILTNVGVAHRPDLAASSCAGSTRTPATRPGSKNGILSWRLRGIRSLPTNCKTGTPSTASGCPGMGSNRCHEEYSIRFHWPVPCEASKPTGLRGPRN